MPSVTKLRDRLNTAAAAAAGVVIDGLQTELPRSVQNDTLMATGAKFIALRKDGTSRPTRRGGNAAWGRQAI